MLRTWTRINYMVQEIPFDHDLHEFQVIKNDKVVATITPADIESQTVIISDLDAGEDVNGWEDGMGNTIHI